MKILIFALSLFAACAAAAQSVESADWGKTRGGRAVKIYTLKNKNGAEARFCDYGATLVSLKVPDRNGALEDVVLGFDDIAGYEKYADNYFGAQLGRYGGRIEAGKFSIDGKEYRVSLNEKKLNNHLHGGFSAFDRRIWNASAKTSADAATVEFSIFSPDGDEGFPGNLQMKVSFTLTNGNELAMEYTGSTDKPTHVNMTNHIYYNLSGEGKGTIANHELTINGDCITPHNKNLIPFGTFMPVAGNQFDFRSPRTIGSRIETPNEQMKINRGYSHTYVLNKKEGEFGFALRLYDPISGRQMEMYTTEPGVLFHSGNVIYNVEGKGGKIYGLRYGAVFEPQHFWNSPNQKNFPSTLLRPGQTYKSKTVLKFSAR